MNILYCGNGETENGLLISVLSLIKNVREALHVYVLTMRLDAAGKSYLPVSESFAAQLDILVKKKRP